MELPETPAPDRTPSRLPRGRGFNLLEMFTATGEGEWQEHDFQWIADWGFDFVRLPLSYPLWIEGGAEGTDPCKLYAPGLERVDRAVELAHAYGLHLCLNFHRAPGYCVNPGHVEPFSLWKDQEAVDAFCFHWQTFAERYRGVPPSQLSFNLINEPPAVKEPTHGMTRADHSRVIRAAVAAMREVDSDRLIIVDGIDWGNSPCPELRDLAVGQSCRGYLPFPLSHYRAPWFNGSNSWSAPVWPDLKADRVIWNRRQLERHYARWERLAKQGVWVNCGEGGAYNKTPHAIVLAWLRDVLEVLTSYGIGFVLWNFRGPFGVLDSARPDVDYEDLCGHKLDRKLLSLLQEFA